ncbi:MAG: flagellar M-ring protein FliF C-terminal domain-containing protein [Planctomycetota bacterium]
MKETLGQIWQVMRSTSASARMVMLAGVVLVLAVVGASMYRSANPHMAFFVGDLDNASFARATRALSQAGIRFETSIGGAPYTIFVESGSKYSAHNAIAAAGALDSGVQGIDTGDASSAFDSSVERLQKADARFWQEVEQQLTALHWVRAAKVIAKAPTNRILGRAPKPTVSVVLTTSGMRPTQEQGQNVGNIVRTAFNVPEENITIVDQNGGLVFSGKTQDRLNENLTYQRAFNQDTTQNAQELLDSIYGPGLTRVSVRGEWSFVKTEVVGEALDKKELAEKSSRKSSTPTPTVEGGPAGLEESFSSAPVTGAAVSMDPATRTETDEKYAFGSKTTHRIEDAPVLEHLSVSLTLDSSLAEQSEAIAEQVKAAVGFQLDRGDFIATHTTSLVGVERDENGAPVQPEPIAAPEAPSAMMNLLLERGIELAALLVFLVLLGRSLRQSKKGAKTAGKGAASIGGGGAPGRSAQVDDAEIDPTLLARRHIEDMLDNDPDRVSSLLSRWAMGEEFYAKGK